MSAADSSDVKAAAQLYADAGALNVMIKRLPSLDTLDAYPERLRTNTVVIESAASTAEDLRRDLTAAISDAATAGARFDAGFGSAREVLSKAFSKGQSGERVTGPYAGMLDAARESWAAADDDATKSIGELSTAVKSTTAFTNEQRAAVRAIASVHLTGPQYAAVAKDLAPISAGQETLKPAIGTAFSGEKSARAAQKALVDARRQWGEAKKEYISAESLSVAAEKLYAEASILGAEEAELFGEAL